MIALRDATAAVLLAALGALFINVEPAIASALAAGFQLDSAFLGIVLSIESAGMLAGGFFAFVALARWEPRAFTAIALLAYVSGNIATVVVTGAIALILFRSITGIAEGAIIGVAFAVMSGAKAPHRMFGTFGIVQTFSAVAAFALLGWLTHQYGWRAAFVLLAVAGACCVFALPSNRVALTEREEQVSGALDRAGVLGLLSILVFFTCEAMIWPFLERIGAARGVGDFAIAGALSFGALCGLAGSAMITALPAAAIGLRACIAAVFLNVSAIAILANSTTGGAFFVALGLFNFAWALFAPLQLSLLKKVSAAPRTFTLASAATTAGFSIGPAIGGFLAREHGYVPAFTIGIVGTFLAFVLIAIPLRSFVESFPGRLTTPQDH